MGSLQPILKSEYIIYRNVDILIYQIRSIETLDTLSNTTINTCIIGSPERQGFCSNTKTYICFMSRVGYHRISNAPYFDILIFRVNIKTFDMLTTHGRNA